MYKVRYPMISVEELLKEEMKKPHHHFADISGIKTIFLNLAYADESEFQKLDLYLPDTGEKPYPLIIYIHGGAFMKCDKQDEQVEPYFMALKHGYAVASLNYRLSGEATFPSAVYDCKAAVRYLKANAAKYGLDAGRFALTGGSAGAYLTLMTAMTPNIAELEDLTQGNPDYDSSIRCAVTWYAPTDFTKMDEMFEESGINGDHHGGADSPESLFMGGDIEKLDSRLLKQANPLSYIHTTDAASIASAWT